MHLDNITPEFIADLLRSDIELLNDKSLVDLGYKLQSIWNYSDELDYDLDLKSLSLKMREVYYCALSRAQHTKDLKRLSILVPSLPFLIYSPNLPENEDAFEPIDNLVWEFAQVVSEHPNIESNIKKAAIEALMVETKDIDVEDLLIEPVYVWALNHKLST